MASGSLVLAAAVAGGTLIGTGPASANVNTAYAYSPAAAEERCGYLGYGKYRHCDGGTGSTIMLDVEDIWGNIGRYCVGPGVTNLQPTFEWRVIGAWWNGGVGCWPGRVRGFAAIR
ncbi:DUF6355 family natural product biosynthesis protein [Amycolatopsis aidingensis]|uniref:DUF6355 family natural product biosynthesis protein n=1 Tax=Amycolatopsis aidingensis TaxID=2842453 RepID=UPI001E3961ED|nr:DUF6355 family natural product biosynthesis protein [Amycolatopsis aidingensis]